MRRALIIILAVMHIAAFCACKEVIVTSADELRATPWQTETKSGIIGILIFEDDTATFSVYTNSGEELSAVSGIAAVDSTHFYITDTDLCKTYTFSYKVFGDRAEVTYGADTLIFTPYDNISTPDE